MLVTWVPVFQVITATDVLVCSLYGGGVQNSGVRVGGAAVVAPRHLHRHVAQLQLLPALLPRLLGLAAPLVNTVKKCCALCMKRFSAANSFMNGQVQRGQHLLSFPLSGPAVRLGR